MEIWIVLLILSATFFVIGALVPSKKTVKPDHRAIPLTQSGDDAMTALPNDLNENSISGRLVQLRDTRPDLIPHFIESLKQRWINRQDDRTAKCSIELLRRVLERLKLEHQCRQTMEDLQLMGLQRSKRLKELELNTKQTEWEHEKLEQNKKSHTALHEITLQRDVAKLQLEIAQTQAEMERIRSSGSPQSRLTPEEQRFKDRAACEARLATLKEEKQKALKLQEEAERALRVNAIDDAIQREMDRWAKLL